MFNTWLGKKIPQAERQKKKTNKKQNRKKKNNFGFSIGNQLKGQEWKQGDLLEGNCSNACSCEGDDDSLVWTRLVVAQEVTSGQILDVF